ncbi:MAG: type 1 glutamine amidotransferase [Methylobacterium sp.]|nr:type 1 glutamine amidotransferase [Methylobacterium sp.]
MSLRFLVMEGSPAPARERYREALGRTPAQHYGDVLVQVAGGGSFDIVCPADPGGKLPEGAILADYDGVAITGSPLHIWKREPESIRQIELAREVFRSGVPFFGSCWGLQVAAVAAGGHVQKNPRGREFGFARRIAPTADGARHALLAGRPALFDAPCSHLDEVAALPADSTLLASNAVSRVQAAEIRYQGGTFWGVQYHPEYVHSVLAYILDQRAGDLVAEGFFVDKAQSSAYSADLVALDAEPRRDICWRLGLNADVVDPIQRRTEIANFVAWCKAEASQSDAA